MLQNQRAISQGKNEGKRARGQEGKRARGQEGKRARGQKPQTTNFPREQMAKTMFFAI